MQSMHVLPQGVGYTYDMDLGVRELRGKRELALVCMGWKADHTISHVYTTYFILKVSDVRKVCTFYHRMRINTYNIVDGFVDCDVNAN